MLTHADSRLVWQLPEPSHVSALLHSVSSELPQDCPLRKSIHTGKGEPAKSERVKFNDEKYQLSVQSFDLRFFLGIGRAAIINAITNLGDITISSCSTAFGSPVYEQSVSEG